MTYIIEQTWLPNSKHSTPRCHFTWASGVNMFVYLCQNTANYNFYFTCDCQIITQNKYVHYIGHICQILPCAQMGYVCTYMPHMTSLETTKQQGVLHKYLTYITKQILPPHSNCSLYGQCTKGACGPNIFAYICQNTTNYTFYFTCYCQICARKKHAHHTGIVCHIYWVLNMYIQDWMQLYMPHIKTQAPTNE